MDACKVKIPVVYWNCATDYILDVIKDGLIIVALLDTYGNTSHIFFTNRGIGKICDCMENK